MSTNKEILLNANEAVSAGDHEGFLAYCTDDTVWDFVGDQILRGKEAVRQYMAKAYLEPPLVSVDELISEGDMLTAMGNIRMKNEQGVMTSYSYCDVWRLRDGKLAELRAFVVEEK